MTELQALQLQRELKERRDVIWNKSVIPNVITSSKEWVSGVSEDGEVYELSFTLVNPYAIMVQAVESGSGVIQNEDIVFRTIISDTFAEVILKMITNENLVCNNLEGYYLSSSEVFSYIYTTKSPDNKVITLKMNNVSITIEDTEVNRLAEVLNGLKGLDIDFKDVTLVQDPFNNISLHYSNINDIKLDWSRISDKIELTFNNDEDFQGFILHMKTVIAIGKNLDRYEVPLGNLILGCKTSNSITFRSDDGGPNIVTWVAVVDDNVFVYKSTWNEFNIIVERMDKFFRDIYIKCNQTL